MLGSLFLGAFLAIAPTTVPLPVSPIQPLTYLEANLSPWTDELSARDPFPYPELIPDATSSEYVERVISKVFGKDAPKMSKIAHCESDTPLRKLDPEARNINALEDSVSIFQINTLAHHEYTPKDFKKIETNVEYAKTLFDREGLGPWKICSSRL